jgi:hypothetical protein
MWLVCACAVLPARAQDTGGAKINEGLETVSIYVDTNTGSDSNPGTQQLPLKTISAAAAIATANSQNNIGTAVMIDPGTYRESVSVALASGQVNTDWPMTFEATPGLSGAVIVSGADIWGGWTPSSLYPQLYTNLWPYQWGECAPSAGTPSVEPDILLRREMTFINGTPLTQVLSLSELTSAQFTNPGSFYVDEIGGMVYVWPPSGTDMSTATVEVSTRPNAFSIDGWSYVVLRGLTFEYANSCRFDTLPGGQAVTVVASTSNPGSNNIWLDNDSFLWNNSQGLNVAQPATAITVGDPAGDSTIANHNGQSGFQAYTLDNVLWQNDEASFNNWRGAQGAFYNWNSAGLHSYRSHDTSFLDITTNFNQTYGMHWDTDHANILTTSLISSSNIDSAQLIEASEGPMTISGSYLCYSGLLGDGGLRLRDTEFLTVTNDVLYDNNPSQILVNGNPGGTWVTNWQTGQTTTVYTQNLTLGGTQGAGNTVEAVDGAANQQVFQDGQLGGTEWTAFQTTLFSNYNTWWDAEHTAVFIAPVPNPSTPYNFHGWKGLTLQDSNSVFQAPSGNPFANCQVTADAPDYWFTVTSSPVVATQTTAAFTVTVTSLDEFNGTVNLQFDGLENVAGASGSWSPATITGSGPATFTVNVSGSTPAGNYPVVLIANSGNLTHTATVNVLANCGASLSRTNLNFGSIRAATSSVAQTVNLTNLGTTTLTGISVGAPSSNAFVIESGSDTCSGKPLAVGASCSFSVIFSPQAAAPAGPQSGTISISDPDASSPQIITLTGHAPVAPLTLSPVSVDFGSVQLGSNSTQAVTLTNTDTRQLIVSGMVIVGANPADFTETNNCGFTVLAGASCVINVTFTPAAVGTRSATLVIEDDAAGNPQSLTFSGNGLGVPAVALSPTSLKFATQLVGTSSSPKLVTLTNTGTGVLAISSVTLSGTDAADFSETNTCGSSVAAGATCTIDVTFTPSAAGSRSATLSIADNAPGSPQTVSLSGKATVVQLSPSSLNFGAVSVGHTSPPQTITLTNTGSAKLGIMKIAITGSGAADFAETNACGKTLQAGQSCEISVTFTPLAKGNLAADVTVNDSGGGSPQTVTLSGKGR